MWYLFFILVLPTYTQSYNHSPTYNSVYQVFFFLYITYYIKMTALNRTLYFLKVFQGKLSGILNFNNYVRHLERVALRPLASMAIVANDLYLEQIQVLTLNTNIFLFTSIFPCTLWQSCYRWPPSPRTTRIQPETPHYVYAMQSPGVQPSAAIVTDERPYAFGHGVPKRKHEFLLTRVIFVSKKHFIITAMINK